MPSRGAFVFSQGASVIHTFQAISAAGDLATIASTVYTAARILRSGTLTRRRPQPSSVPSTPVNERQEQAVIEILGRSGEPEAMNCPVLICDACRKQVVDSGNIIWGSTVGVEPRLSTPLFVSHKGHCDQIVSKDLEEQYPGEQWAWLWEEAGHFLRYLAGNFKKPFSDDPDGTFHEHQIALPQGSARR